MANYAKQTQFSVLQYVVSSAYTKDYEENRHKIVMKKQTQSCPPQADSNPIKANLARGQK
jgi:hypothetical protein